MLGEARSTIQDDLKRARVTGLTWPLPDDVTNAALEVPDNLKACVNAEWSSERFCRWGASAAPNTEELMIAFLAGRSH
ncbi:hypothetical protein [Acidocella aminolytica]|jgi:hypothetical protein|uniref:Transposase n=1 Tax=Acidocella aminolytica 101 = DSM 11237 TaxID=1120923 RepID=A0A0D6PB55_9PROT|nr:hypothetical protein [Acidocella aminolytica]GAN78887.1 hypothetical protein Aam_011_008 [Acidocella aminolytica 101 = DSM 11237]GBQ42313.1 hypothetical protein AA11237_2940 [Acidocella aminolytica 101 = DSM 11237]SHE98483.1 hypothetical protein SAMN02746095_01754 [Acidocella aminolytica 101 = DSM 11237]